MDSKTIFLQDGEMDSAYGIYLTIDDLSMFDELHKCNAKKKVDIAVKYNGTVKEYDLDKFLELLGF